MSGEAPSQTNADAGWLRLVALAKTGSSSLPVLQGTKARECHGPYRVRRLNGVIWSVSQARAARRPGHPGPGGHAFIDFDAAC